MKRLRLEGRLLRQADEWQFLEAWERDWETGIDLGSETGIMTGVSIGTSDAAVDKDEIIFQAMTGMKHTDLMTRDSRWRQSSEQIMQKVKSTRRCTNEQSRMNFADWRTVQSSSLRPLH
jgi:hypothetical protein